MEIITPPKQTFMARFTRYEPASQDSTSVMAYKKCERFYFLTIVLGFRSKDKPVYFRFGSAVHKFDEVLENTKDLKTALEAAAALFKKEGGDPSVEDKKYGHLTGARLLETCMLIYADWQKEKAQGRVEVLAVEQAFEVFLSDGVTRRGGKADKFIRWNGKLWGKDRKTTTRGLMYYEQSVDPNDQFTGYILGLSKLSGEYVQGLVIDVVSNEKNTKAAQKHPELRQFTVQKTPQALERWEKDQINIAKKLQSDRENDEWPMRETGCYRCIMRSVCTKGSEQAMMNQLTTHFIQKPWDYKTLGDEVDS